MLYVKEGINFKTLKTNDNFTELPSISGEISISREKSTTVNFFYREWTNGVTGENTNESQIKRLKRQINHQKESHKDKKDIIIMGDANICAFEWKNETYRLNHLAEPIQDFLLKHSCIQMVNQYTRSECVRNITQRSCIDHCYSDVPEKLSKP